MLTGKTWCDSPMNWFSFWNLRLVICLQIVDISETLEIFMELQTVGDRKLKELAFCHVIGSITGMNLKNRNYPKNRELQNILFKMVQKEEEATAKRALIVLCELYRRKVWFDDRTANAICMACFHSSSTIMIAALSFLLDYEKIDYEDDSDDPESGDDHAALHHQVVLSKEAIYKANHKGTTSSKKKKRAKLRRVIRSGKKQQRRSSEKHNRNYSSPWNHLNDAQVKMMLLKTIARNIGLHHLILLEFYPYLQKYVQPHQRNVTSLLAAAIQACHDMAICIGLNTVREICLRMPLLMTDDLLQDLVLYRKSHEKAVCSASRSLTLFREICPSLLVKKDRGRPTDPKARPKAFGEMHIASNVPGVELLEQDDAHNDEDVEERFYEENQEDDGVGLMEEDARDESDIVEPGGSGDAVDEMGGDNVACSDDDVLDGEDDEVST